MYDLYGFFFEVIIDTFQFTRCDAMSTGCFAEARPALEAIDYRNVSDVVAAEFFVNFFYQSFTLAELNINVNVGWLGALRI